MCLFFLVLGGFLRQFPGAVPLPLHFSCISGRYSVVLSRFACTFRLGARFLGVRGRALPEHPGRGSTGGQCCSALSVVHLCVGCVTIGEPVFVRQSQAGFPLWNSGVLSACFELSPLFSFPYRATSQEPILSNLRPRASRSSPQTGGTLGQTHGRHPKNWVTEFGPSGSVVTKDADPRTGTGHRPKERRRFFRYPFGGRRRSLRHTTTSPRRFFVGFLATSLKDLSFGSSRQTDSSGEICL